MTPLRILLLAIFIISLTLRLTKGLKPLDKRCCKAAQDSRQCVKECRKLLRQPIRNNSSRRAEGKVVRRLKSCPLVWTSFWRCVNESISDSAPTATSPSTTLQHPVPQGRGHSCCKEATTDLCRSMCNHISASEIGLDDTGKVEYLIPYCGSPPRGPLWNCFLSEDGEPESTRIEGRMKSLSVPTVGTPALPADAMKIQCCSRAVSENCRDMCTEYFSYLVASKQAWSIFEASCLLMPEELVLHRCIEDVLGVCKLGCKGLTYCQAFNNRPLQTFRQCTIAADISARNDLTSWIRNGLPDPLASFPLRHISKCQPAAWKALACVFQVKPCHPETHVSKICYSDCMWLVDKCGDKKQMYQRGLSSKIICDRITPFNTTCISLRDFISSEETNVIEGDDTTLGTTDVTYPCQPNPCRDGFVCEVNRECLTSRAGCTSYRCVRGCNTDMRSVFFVEQGDWVKVGVAGQSDCSQLCQCGERNRIKSCQPATCGNVHRNCTHQQQVYEHGDVYLSDCSRCGCYDGQMRCSSVLGCNNSTVDIHTLVCENVACPPLQSNCKGVVPHGRCCPICGATISFFVDYLTTNSSHNTNHHVSANTITEILRHLKRLVNTFECDVQGLSSDAGSLTILVKSTVESPRAIHVNVCNAEAQRLVSLFTSRSPIITSNPTLENLMSPQMQQPTLIDTNDLAVLIDTNDLAVLPSNSGHVTQPISLLSVLLIFIHWILLSR